MQLTSPRDAAEVWSKGTVVHNRSVFEALQMTDNQLVWGTRMKGNLHLCSSSSHKCQAYLCCDGLDEEECMQLSKFSRCQNTWLQRPGPELQGHQASHPYQWQRNPHPHPPQRGISVASHD